MIDYNVLLTTVSVAAALLFGYFAFARSRRNDDSKLVENLTKISSDVMYIRSAIDELKNRQSALEKNYENLLERICKLEVQNGH